MATEQKTAKILAAINERGWFVLGVYDAEAKALKAAGKIKFGSRYTGCGDTVFVWVAA